MKNIHILPTDKPSRLKQNKITKKISLVNKGIDLTFYNPINIYITFDEEIKVGDYWFDGTNIRHDFPNSIINGIDKKIILTTDQSLINDGGVQEIDDDFLVWFVKNPSCEEVEVKKWSSLAECGYSYHINIPQETLEEAAERIYDDNLFSYEKYRSGFIKGAKWQQERMYSEEEVRKLLWEYIKPQSTSEGILLDAFLEQFKKK